jgi:hypothetical protein
LKEFAPDSAEYIERNFGHVNRLRGYYTAADHKNEPSVITKAKIRTGYGLPNDLEDKMLAVMRFVSPQVSYPKTTSGQATYWKLVGDVIENATNGRIKFQSYLAVEFAYNELLRNRFTHHGKERVRPLSPANISTTDLEFRRLCFEHTRAHTKPAASTTPTQLDDGEYRQTELSAEK